MMIKPMLAEPALISGALLLLLGILVFAAVIAGIVALVVLLVRAFKKPGQKQQADIFSSVFSGTVRPATAGPQPQSPPASDKTQVIRKCPQCGAVLQPDVPEGLCPACLLQHGIATEGGAPPGTPPFVPPPMIELGKLFPQLEILELIGQGGMGAVYKARQPALDRFVALKILAPRSGGDVDFAGRFTREARALARLSHPNIVGVYDFGQVDRLNYFIMEFVDGPNLRQAGKLSPRVAMEIIPQICAALQFAHDEGIVHRDIKPENVLLDKKGRVKIADFGLAKILGQEQKDLRLTGVRDVMGTPHYMAPEQVEHPQDVDHRADIYSLGVVFYEMLTGELPLGKFQSPSQKVQVDVRLDEVVLRSLAKEPELRYQHVSEIGTRVETIASGVADRTPPLPSSIPNGPRPLLRGLKVAGWIFLICLLVSATVSFLMPKTYMASARLYIPPVAQQAAGNRPTNTYRAPGPDFVQTEVQVLSSLDFLKKVSASLDLAKRWGEKFNGGTALSEDHTAALLQQRIEVVLPPRSPFVIIRCYSESATEAAEIINNLVGIYCSLQPDALVKIIDHAVAPIQPARPNHPLNIFVGAVAGVVVGLLAGGLVAIVSFLKAPRLRTDSAKPDRFWRRFAVVMACVVLLPVAIAIIGILAAMAIPAFVKARHRAQAVAEYNQRALTDQNSAVLFDHVGKTWFPKGDSIDILSVERSENHMTVKGLYNLISANNARLALYVTSTNEVAIEEDPAQATLISRGTGDFELVYPHPVAGLPHITMYSANGKGFAEIYFGSKAEAEAESRLELGPTNPPPASAETWSPALAPGEKPNLEQIRQDAKQLMETMKYEEALQRHLWFFNHALEYEPSLSGVRLSFTLSDWVELGRHYPKAKRALIEIRDQKTRELAEGRGHSEMFQEVDALNRELQTAEDTYALFKKLETSDPQLAGQCYLWIEGVLVEKGEYETCSRYLGDPQRRFEINLRSWKQMKSFEERGAARDLEQLERYKAMSKTNAGLKFLVDALDRPKPPPYADPHFIDQTRRLIEILVGTGRQAEAEKIRDLAVAALDDARLKSAVSDAEQTVAKRTSPK